MPLDGVATFSGSEFQSTSTPDPSPLDFGKKKKKKAPTACTFADRYELTGTILGKGSFSVVKEVRDKKHGVAFAAKFVDKKSASFDRKQVLGEIAILQKCKSQDAVIQFIEYFEEDEDMILIFEKLDGGALMDHIKKTKIFTEREASFVVRDVATALTFLHSQGIVHRDIKPENILCVFKDKVFPVKLCDFNLVASREQMSDALARSAPVGTPEFLPPEMAAAIASNTVPPYDELCDVWSLGVILHIMLTGTAPFSGNCGQDCGWERGEPCEYCAEDLFENISRGKIDFATDAWRRVSGAAKDLVARMLVRAPERLSAKQVLQHPWVTQVPPDTHLPTPSKLGNVSSLDSFVSDANEKIRIADVKTPAHRKTRSSVLASPFSSVQARDLLEIHTPLFQTPSPQTSRQSLLSSSTGVVGSGLAHP